MILSLKLHPIIDNADCQGLHLFICIVGLFPLIPRCLSSISELQCRVTFLAAETCLVAGSIRNAYHTKYRGIFGGEHLSCATLRKGVFAAAAALTLMSMIGSVVYYWIHSKADTGGWQRHQNEGIGMAASDRTHQPHHQTGDVSKP